MPYLASDLLSAIRRGAGIAASSAASPEGLQDADLLPLVDQKLRDHFLPMLLSIQEEWLVSKKTYAAGTGSPDTYSTGTWSTSIPITYARLRVPNRSIGGRISDVVIRVGDTQWRLKRMQPTDREFWQSTPSAGGAPYGYYVEGEWLVMLPLPSPVPDAIDVYYPCRPGRLTVTANDFRVITSASGTQTLNFATWTSPDAGAYDVVRGASGFGPLFVEQGVAFATATTATVPKDVRNIEAFNPDPGILAAVGDYLTKTDTSPLVPLPAELHGALTMRCVAAVLRQLGKRDEANDEDKSAQEVETRQVQLLTPRVEAAPKKVVGKFMRRGFGGLGPWRLR